MWTIGDMKKRGREAFKQNYWRCVVAAVLLYLLIGATAGSGANSGKNAAKENQDLAEAFNSLSPNELGIVLAAILGAVTVVIIVALVLRIFVFNPLQVGCYRFFRKNTENPPADLGVIKEGFGGYGRVFLTLLLRDIFLCLWTCLFLIPGIVKCYSYRMVPYILKDNPELSATEVITRSRQMMQGNKGKAFLMDLSFLGWFILSLFPLVAILWTNPYYESSKAALYLELKQKGAM